MTGAEILDLPMQPNDAKASNIREYLKKLLVVVWSEGEDFSGKRPFGNSSWENELFVPLVKHGVIDGKLDEDDEEFLDRCDYSAGERAIYNAINAL